MDFAVCPDVGVPRLFRFTKLSDPSVVAELDPGKNLLRIDREAFDLLSSIDQQRVNHTRQRTVFVKANGAGGLTIDDGRTHARHAAE